MTQNNKPLNNISVRSCSLCLSQFCCGHATAWWRIYKSEPGLVVARAMWVQASRGIAQYGATWQVHPHLWALCRHHYIPKQGKYTVSHIIRPYFMIHLQLTDVVLSSIFFLLGWRFRYSVAWKAWQIKPHESLVFQPKYPYFNHWGTDISTLVGMELCFFF